MCLVVYVSLAEFGNNSYLEWNCFVSLEWNCNAGNVDFGLVFVHSFFWRGELIDGSGKFGYLLLFVNMMRFCSIVHLWIFKACYKFSGKMVNMISIGLNINVSGC